MDKIEKEWFDLVSNSFTSSLLRVDWWRKGRAESRQRVYPRRTVHFRVRMINARFVMMGNARIVMPSCFAMVVISRFIKVRSLSLPDSLPSIWIWRWRANEGECKQIVMVYHTFLKVNGCVGNVQFHLINPSYVPSFLSSLSLFLPPSRLNKKNWSGHSKPQLLTELRFLSTNVWSFQTNYYRSLGSLVMCDLDSRNWSLQYCLHGAYWRSRKYSKISLETRSSPLFSSSFLPSFSTNTNESDWWGWWWWCDRIVIYARRNWERAFNVRIGIVILLTTLLVRESLDWKLEWNRLDREEG